MKILMRYMRFVCRRRRFTSTTEINRALVECVEKINARRHSRFGVSRRERFETLERAALKSLPLHDVDAGEWKEAKLHADGYVPVDGDYYSAPHNHRHKKLRIKITDQQGEIFWRLERVALHTRCRHRSGKRILSTRTFRQPPRPTTRPHHKGCCRNRGSSTPSDRRHDPAACHFVPGPLDLFGTATHDALAAPQVAEYVRRDQLHEQLTMRRHDKVRVPYFDALLT